MIYKAHLVGRVDGVEGGYVELRCGLICVYLYIYLNISIYLSIYLYKYINI